MIAGIMQPYFFPYFGYFDHISRCDVWIVFDISQYTPKSWMTRNRILHPEKEWQYINYDVHGSQHMLTADVRVRSLTASRQKLLGQLTAYKKYAPYYRQIVELVERTFAEARSDTLTNLDVSGLAVVCDYLSIPFKPVIASEARFPLPSITHAGQWALEICTLLGADTYLNTPGGRELFHPEEFAARNIRLAFTRVPNFTYDCAPHPFVPCLSILDVLMWNSPETVRAALGKEEIDYV